MDIKAERTLLRVLKYDSSLPAKEGSSVPSGFVLKLYQMVNGAPDEIISWLPDGDAFRISDLHRLENETLPAFFRHRRFQSLVRQLNFYNFRKVNRERTFWVYRHSLFHRDRPSELYLLRRRTCPGVDGRKHRPDLDIKSLGVAARFSKTEGIDTEQQYDLSDESVDVLREMQYNSNQYYSNDANKSMPTSLASMKNTNTDDDNKVINQNKMATSKSTMHNLATIPCSLHHSFTKNKSYDSRSTNEIKYSNVTDRMNESIETISLEFNVKVSEGLVSPCTNETRYCDTISDQSPSTAVKLKEKIERNNFNKRDCEGNKKDRTDWAEQSVLVNKVTRQLEVHAKRAAAAVAIVNSRRGGRRRGGIVTPPSQFATDTMKYHALTYDDEIENIDLDEGSSTKNDDNKLKDKTVVVTDADDSEDDLKMSASRKCSIVLSETFSPFKTSYVSTKGKANTGVLRNEELFKLPPIDDVGVISEVVRKLHNWIGHNHNFHKEDRQITAVMTGFCMSTAPQDPLLGDKARQILIACDVLAQEFHRYKAALSPDFTTPCLISSQQIQPVLVSKIFEGDSGAKDTVRIFKVFALNSLANAVQNKSLVKDVGLSQYEAECFNDCVSIWYEGVISSP